MGGFSCILGICQAEGHMMMKDKLLDEQVR